MSCNWAGEPLTNYAKMLHLIEATTTEQGLTVQATLNQKSYPTRIKIPDAHMAQLHLHKHEALPKWNYTLKPFH